MSYLVANLPQIQCYVRKEYLYDFEKGHGEYEPCYWVSVKSILGKALYIEAYLTDYTINYLSQLLHGRQTFLKMIYYL